MTLEGLVEVLANIAALEARMSVAMEDAATAAALVGEKYTKEGAPVDTGKLRRGITTRLESRSVDQVVMRTGTDVEYDPAQEFGTSRMAGTPHWSPGFFNHAAEELSAALRVLRSSL